MAQHHHPRAKHLLALLAAPSIVFLAVWVTWGLLKQQCVAFSAAECLPIGSTTLGASEVALLATFLAAGLATIVEIAAD